MEISISSDMPAVDYYVGFRPFSKDYVSHEYMLRIEVRKKPEYMSMGFITLIALATVMILLYRKYGGKEDSHILEYFLNI